MGWLKDRFTAPRVDMAPMTNIWSRRQGEIADFERKLDSYTTEYLNSLSMLQQNAWNNFVPNTAAMYGARGIFTDSGAFADTIGREAANLQAQMAPAAAEMKRSNAQMVDSARGNNTGAYMTANWQKQLQDTASQGALNANIGKLGMMAAGSFFGPLGGALGGLGGDMLFGGGQTGTMQNGRMVMDQPVSRKQNFNNLWR